MIRGARPEEAPALSDLAFRSKAHWGYDAAFMAACRAELTVTAAMIAAGDVFVAEDDGGVAGFHAFARLSATDVDILMFFVEPTRIGQGIGAALFAHLVAESRHRGYRTLVIDADPFAAPFYARMGATAAGSTPSGSIHGRAIPRLTFAL